jgi:hypothetical protein
MEIKGSASIGYRYRPGVVNFGAGHNSGAGTEPRDVGGLGRKRALLEIEHAGALRAGLARREKAQLTSIEENKAAVRRW